MVLPCREIHSLLPKFQLNLRLSASLQETSQEHTPSYDVWPERRPADFPRCFHRRPVPWESGENRWGLQIVSGSAALSTDMCVHVDVSWRDLSLQTDRDRVWWYRGPSEAHPFCIDLRWGFFLLCFILGKCVLLRTWELASFLPTWILTWLAHDCHPEITRSPSNFLFYSSMK